MLDNELPLPLLKQGVQAEGQKCRIFLLFALCAQPTKAGFSTRLLKQPQYLNRASKEEED